MSNLTGDKYLELVEKSGLLEAAVVTKALADFEAELSATGKSGSPAPADPSKTDGQRFIEYLRRVGLVTEWQADKLLQGRHKGFFLGNYKLLRHLGSGGMSAVFLAEHKHMRQRRAVKVLPQARVNDSSYLGRFYREARAAAAVEHPNIVRAYDVDNDGDNHFLVMEFVEGQDLQKIVDSGGVLPYETAAEYIRQSAAGLSHAHGVGLVHRDIKPANLLVDPKGTVKVLDMGLARFNDDEKQASLTQMHEENVLGTADYLAPEQARDSHTVDARADIYSLGCTLYFSLTGHPPFNEGTLTQRLLAHQNREPPAITVDRPDAPKDLLAICRKMMAKDRDQRYSTALDVEQALTQWLVDRGAMRPSGGAFQQNTNRPAPPRAAPMSPGANRPGGAPPQAQRIAPKAKGSDSSGAMPAVHDTLSGQGQPTTKGPAGRSPDVAPGDSSSKLGKKPPVAKSIEPPGSGIGKGGKPADASGGFNFQIKTDGSDIHSTKYGKKPLKPGDSGKQPAVTGGTGSSKSNVPNKAISDTSVPKTAKPGAIKGSGKDASGSAKAPALGAAKEADGKPVPLKKLRKKGMSVKALIVIGVGVLLLAIGLVAGLIIVLQKDAERKRENMEKLKAKPAAPVAPAAADTISALPAPVAPATGGPSAAPVPPTSANDIPIVKPLSPK